MARTWSNIKRPPNALSVAQREKLGRPSGLNAFLIAMVLVSAFFLGLTLYSAYQAERYPLTEVHQLPSNPPKAE